VGSVAVGVFSSAWRRVKWKKSVQLLKGYLASFYGTKCLHTDVKSTYLLVIGRFLINIDISIVHTFTFLHVLQFR